MILIVSILLGIGHTVLCVILTHVLLVLEHHVYIKEAGPIVKTIYSILLLGLIVWVLGIVGILYLAIN